MSIFDKLKNKKKPSAYCVVKAFKTVKQTDVINIKPCFDIMLDVFLSKEYSLKDIEVNYGSRKWKTVNSFYKFLEKNDVVDFGANFEPKGYSEPGGIFATADLDCSSISYSNHLLNLTYKTDEKDYIEFNLVVPMEWYCLELVKTVIKELDSQIGLTYAYVCFLPKNYSISAEKPLKVTLFSVSSNVSKDDLEIRNNLKDIDCGYFPKLYPVNLLNSCQQSSLGSILSDVGELHDVSKDLKLWVLSEDEIALVYKLHSFPIL